MLYLTYVVRHVWYVFRWSTGKKYTSACEICGRGTVLDTKQTETLYKKSPIPMMDRFGWLIGVGALASMAAVGTVGSVAHDDDVKSYLANPSTGDLYTVDFAKMRTSPSSREEHGVMKIVRISGGKAEFALSKMVSNNATAPNVDINSGLASADTYYAGDHIAIPIDKLPKMRADGIIEDIHR